MKTVNVTYTVYDFSELSNNAKDKVKAWYLSRFDRNEEFSDRCEEELSLHFPKSDLKSQYSLAYCQGDGVNIYGTLNLKDVLYDSSVSSLTSFKPEETFTEKEKEVLSCYARECGWEITLPCNNRYGYCMADRIDFAEEWEYILTEIAKPCEKVDRVLIRRFEKYIIDLFTGLCAELESAGYHFLYTIADSSMESVCDAYDWMFLENGTLFSV